MNGVVLAVNSTAVASNVQPSYNGTVLRCSEYADLSMFIETVLRVAGEKLAYNNEASLFHSCTIPWIVPLLFIEIANSFPTLN